MKNNKILIAIAVILLVSASAGFFFKDSISILFGPKAAVNKALTMFKTQKLEEGSTSVFDYSYVSTALEKYKYYQIDEWKLTSIEKDGKTYVEVDGTTTNAFGAKLQRNPVFVLTKTLGDWRIIDSYGFFVFDGDMDIPGKSDLEKDKLMQDMKEKVKIDKWSWNRTGYGGAVEGKGVVVNESELPISYLKMEVTYSDNAGNVVNTDETYVVSDKLAPGQRKQFTWYTSDCYGCDNAQVKLLFE
ncbi:FxLYD domain-containing protein [Dyadobacter psychrotolerans]|uniref:Uncharacterized protein n=1 Tax=Dyadobacter psychrotolerans TaxID=2541721 RepID=A0A4R5DMN9_9BACT|nr:FxLYD domain-containing protein [Dyadobacter psychrotolerans]TDE15552.1 hypothetical protein E0F88_13695 [Dyadobacter psychrotolerans]